MDIRIFLEYNGKIMQLPITPPEITIVRAGNNEKTEVVKLGEVRILKEVSLAEITISSFFPATSLHPAVTTKGSFAAPDEYIQFIRQIRLDKKPCFLVITGLDVAMKASIENFTRTMEGGDNDISYTLVLGEYREWAQRELSTVNTAAQKTTTATNEVQRTSTKTAITVGAAVLVNGRLHGDSAGNGAGVTETNATRRVSLIATGAACPYHVTTLDGGWRGWVTADSVVLL
ncbi:hypothetical protein LJB77_02795 [Ruminococcaceae bacterium OttesenSCG-928-N02]|nr:hypothetical protein [Ruminococcaceae bacterium OttesenSCG-928-N02]